MSRTSIGWSHSLQIDGEAKVREACAHTGSIGEGVTVSMDIEQIIYETGRLRDAASLLNRLSRE